MSRQWVVLHAIKKDNDKYTYKKLDVVDSEPTEYPSYGEMLNGNFVIDVDNKQAEKVVDKWLSKYNVSTRKEITLHGAHYWFKGKLPTGTVQTAYCLACGIRADIRNKEWITIKRDGVMYENNGIDAIAELPRFLLPIKKSKEKAEETWLEGDNISRNNELRDIMLSLSKFFNGDALVEMIQNINDITLVKPLDKSELKSTILRAESVEYCDNKSDDKADVREYVREYVETYQPVNIISNRGQTVKDRIGLYAFDGVGYREIDVDIVSQDIYIMHEDFDTVQGEKAWKYITRDYKHPTMNINQMNYNEFTPFLNGVLNTKTGEFITGGNKPEHKNTLVIDCDYKDNYIEDDTSKLVDDFMHTLSCDNIEIEEFLWTWLGLCLAKSTPLDKILFMYGSGENLKSYFMSMVENVFPCINRPIKKLGDDFGCEGIDNGYIMYSTEMYEGNMSETCGDITRQISSQDTISINGKYQSLRQARPFCKMMYATNNEVKLGVGKNAKRRTIYIPFSWNRKYNRGVNSKLLEKLGLTIKSLKDWLYADRRVREYVAYKAVKGLRKFLNSSQDLNYDSVNTILPKESVELTKSFLLEHDTVGQWINENDITAEKLEVHNSLLSQKEWYEIYKNWLNSTIDAKDEASKWIELNKLAVKYDTFKARIYSEFNFKPTNDITSIDGLKYRGFKKL